MDDTNAASVRLPFLIVAKAQAIPNRHRLCQDPVAWIEAIEKTADFYRLPLAWVNQVGIWLVV